jgi:hypothetical protein
MWVLGGSSDGQIVNDVWSSTDGASWTLVTADAGWAPVFGQKSVVHDGKIWMLDNEVWCSKDGANWTQTAPAARRWEPRSGHASVYYNDRLWVMGGGAYGSRDVWSSPDGERWTLITPKAEWTWRRDHAAIVHDNRMWVLGGRENLAPDYNSEYFYNDAWWSTDGRHWTSATLEAEWAPRCSHATVSFQDEIWVIGGRNGLDHFDDIWISENGIDWTEPFYAYPDREPAAVVHQGVLYIVGMYVGSYGGFSFNVGTVTRFDGKNWSWQDNAPFSGRRGTALVSSGGRLWLIGGGWIDWLGNWEIAGLSDVWSSNRTSWTLVTSNAEFPGRYEHAAVSDGHRIWIMGGARWGLSLDSPIDPLNDVWMTDLFPWAAARNWEGYE